MCGDYRKIPLSSRIALESTPPVQGLPIKQKQVADDFRITPACAGTTLAVHDGQKKIEYHPRVCGDYAGIIETDPSHRGSPPHVRGLLDFRFSLKSPVRITSACAGTTTITLPKVVVD